MFWQLKGIELLASSDLRMAENAFLIVCPNYSSEPLDKVIILENNDPTSQQQTPACYDPVFIIFIISFN